MQGSGRARRQALESCLACLCLSAGALAFDAQSQAGSNRSDSSQAQIRISFASPNPIVRVGVRETSLRPRVLLKAQGPNLRALAHGLVPVVKDLLGEGPAGLKVTFATPRLVASSDTTIRWVVEVTVEGLPENSQVTRTASLQYRTTSELQEYTITNRPAGTFTWTLTPPPGQLVLTDNDRTTFVVSTGEVPATDLRIVHSTLQEATTDAQLGADHLTLCVEEGDTCRAGQIDLPANHIARLGLRVDSAFAASGAFTGTVYLGVDEKQDPTSFTLTVFSSSMCGKLMGAGVLFAGLALGWFVSVYARNKINLIRALLPARQLQEALDDLARDAAAIKGIPGFAPTHTIAAIKKTSEELNPDKLRAYVPSGMPSAWPLGPDSLGAYQEFLAKKSQRILTLAVIVREGMGDVSTYWSTALSADQQHDIVKALKGLDALATQDDLTKEVAVKQVQDLAMQLTKQLSPGATPQVVGGGAVGAKPTARLPSVQHLLLQLDRVSGLIWLVWGIATLIVGCYYLVWSNHGFGIGLDYLKCFFWGLLGQTTGQQLQQLTPVGVSTSLGISLPQK